MLLYLSFKAGHWTAKEYHRYGHIDEVIDGQGEHLLFSYLSFKAGHSGQPKSTMDMAT